SGANYMQWLSHGSRSVVCHGARRPLSCHVRQQGNIGRRNCHREISETGLLSEHACSAASRFASRRKSSEHLALARRKSDTVLSCSTNMTNDRSALIILAKKSCESLLTAALLMSLAIPAFSESSGNPLRLVQ